MYVLKIAIDGAYRWICESLCYFKQHIIVRVDVVSMQEAHYITRAKRYTFV